MPLLLLRFPAGKSGADARLRVVSSIKQLDAFLGGMKFYRKVDYSLSGILAA
jgi:hypothetical protein